MLAVVCAPVYDPLGYLELQVAADVTASEGTARRISRIATLDGGAVLNDAGYSDADRVFELRFTPPDRAQRDAVARLLRMYGQLVVSTDAGVFRAAPERLLQRDSELQLRLLVLARLSY